MTAEIDGVAADRRGGVANTIVTMVGGQETTTNLIGNGLLDPAAPAATSSTQLRDDPTIIASAVEELLRYESPSQHTGAARARGLRDGRQDDCASAKP